MTYVLSPQELDEAQEVIFSILLGHEEMGKLIETTLSDLTTRMNDGTLESGYEANTDSQTGEEVFFRFNAKVIENEEEKVVIEATYILEAIGNETVFKDRASLHMINGQLKPVESGRDFLLSPLPETLDLINMIYCKGTDVEEPLDKISYVENMGALLEMLT